MLDVPVVQHLLSLSHLAVIEAVDSGTSQTVSSLPLYQLFLTNTVYGKQYNTNIPKGLQLKKNT